MLGLKVTETGLFSAEIIRKVREREALSRVELAREIGVAASTIGRHVDALVKEGYFTETLEPTHEAGRPPTRLRPNPHRGCFIGADLYGQGVYATAVDFAQHTLAQKSYAIDTKAGTDAVLAELAKVLLDMRESAQLPVLAAGLAIPGRVDTRRGIGLSSAIIPGWEDVAITERIRASVGSDVFVENNIRAITLAERWFGEGRGSLEMICLGVRIGVSVGLIKGGELATGFRERAGEIRGWNCPVYDSTSNRWEWRDGATVEKHASVPAAQARFQELSSKKGSIVDFIQAAKSRNPHALMAVREVAAIHGWVISQMVQNIDPELIVLAGPLTELGGVYLDEVTHFAQSFWGDFHPGVPLKTSALGEYAGAVGAAALAMERWRPVDVG